MAIFLSAVAGLLLMTGIVFALWGHHGTRDSVYIAVCSFGAALAFGLVEVVNGWPFPWVRMFGEGVALSTFLYICWSFGSATSEGPRTDGSPLRVLRFMALVAAGTSIGAWSFLDLGASWGFALSGLAILLISVRHLVASREPQGPEQR